MTFFGYQLKVEHFSPFWLYGNSTITQNLRSYFVHAPYNHPECVKLMNPDYIWKGLISKLIEKGLLALTIPDKLRSPHQKYILTETGAKRGKIYE